MHLQHSINTLTQNRASCCASGLPRTALLNDFWRNGVPGHRVTQTQAACGAQCGLGAVQWRKGRPRWSWEVPPKEVFLLQADNAATAAALSGLCITGLTLKMFLTFHRYRKTRFAATWTYSSCSAETLPYQCVSMQFTLQHPSCIPKASLQLCCSAQRVLATQLPPEASPSAESQI